MPSPIAMELAAAACIALGGVLGLAWRSAATGQRIATALLVSALGSVYGSSYWRDAEGHAGGRGLRLWWGIMTAALLAVVLARDAVLFLVAWEAMALAAFFLICTEEQRPEVRRASWIYLVATHAGTLPDATLDRIVLPLAGIADRGFARVRALQRGPVQMYLVYVLLAVVAMLLVAR